MNTTKTAAPLSGRLLAACILMELTWLTASAHYVFTATTALVYPAAILITAYSAGYLTAAGFKKITHRAFQRIFFQVLIWSGITAAALYRLGLWQSPRDIMSWYQTALAVSATLIFWARGTSLLKRPTSYRSVCNHFDIGLALFFLLYVIDLLVVTKAGVQINDRTAFNMMIVFFLIGPAAVFMAVHPPDRASHPGLKEHGILIGTAVFIIGICLAGVYGFNPVLTASAEFGRDLVQRLAEPLYPYLIAFLRFFFGAIGAPPPAGPPGGSSSLSLLDEAMKKGDETGLFTTIVLYAAGSMLVLAAVLILIILGYSIFKWLTKKSVPDAGSGRNPLWRPGLKNRIWKWIQKLIQWAKRRTAQKGKKPSAVNGFIFMQKWGGRNGLARFAGETPGEYSRRLVTYFSSLENEIQVIASAFQEEMFGMVCPGPATIKEIKKARRKMKHPVFWYQRLKCRFRYEKSGAD